MPGATPSAVSARRCWRLAKDLTRGAGGARCARGGDASLRGWRASSIAKAERVELLTGHGLIEAVREAREVPDLLAIDVEHGRVDEARWWRNLPMSSIGEAIHMQLRLRVGERAFDECVVSAADDVVAAVRRRRRDTAALLRRERRRRRAERARSEIAGGDVLRVRSVQLGPSCRYAAQREAGATTSRPEWPRFVCDPRAATVLVATSPAAPGAQRLAKPLPRGRLRECDAT